eukprot:533909-Pyramimonas_sp.AAC.1
MEEKFLPDGSQHLRVLQEVKHRQVVLVAAHGVGTAEERQEGQHRPHVLGGRWITEMHVDASLSTNGYDQGVTLSGACKATGLRNFFHLRGSHLFT